MEWLKRFKNKKTVDTNIEENTKDSIIDPILFSDSVNEAIDKSFLDGSKEQTKDHQIVKKALDRYHNYVKSIQPQNSISDSIDGLKGNATAMEGLLGCASVLEFTALPPSILRLMAQDPLVGLAIETLANQASRDLPTISVYSLKNYSPDQKDYTYLNEFVYNKLVERRTLNLLREAVLQSKTYGVVNILRMPNEKKDESYWAAPFNIESIGIDSEIFFEMIIPDNIYPYYDMDTTDIIYEEPNYWKVRYKGEYLIVHKTHLIRVVETPQYGTEMVRYQYRGRSLVESIYPISKTIGNLEKKRSHLVLIKGVVAINIPDKTITSFNRMSCSDGNQISRSFKSVVSRLSEMMNTTVARSNLIALPEGAELKNIDISLSDVNDNIDSYYRRLAALSSLPLSTLGLTPPRGINDSGAVEADGSRRAIETNQSIILRPILIDIVKIYAKQGLRFIKEINEPIDDLGFDIEFQANDAPTATEEADRAAKWVETISNLVDRKIITKQSALEILTTQITVAFDNAVGLPDYEEDYSKSSAEDIFRQLELDAERLDQKEND